MRLLISQAASSEQRRKEESRTVRVIGLGRYRKMPRDSAARLVALVISDDSCALAMPRTWEDRTPNSSLRRRRPVTVAKRGLFQ